MAINRCQKSCSRLRLQSESYWHNASRFTAISVLRDVIGGELKKEFPHENFAKSSDPYPARRDFENSPALECWVWARPEGSPLGDDRMGEVVAFLSSLTGLWGAGSCNPALKRWAIFRRPCGTGELPAGGGEGVPSDDPVRVVRLSAAVAMQ